MMDGTDEDIDHHVLKQSGENSRDFEWSATTTVLNLTDASSSSSKTDTAALKEYCGNSSDSLKNKDDFMVIESNSSDGHISNYNDDTKYLSTHKTTAFQKRPKPQLRNTSYLFSNILDDDSQLEITSNSICLSHFQKRIRLLPPNNEDFVEIDRSNEMDSVDNSQNFHNLWFSKKNNQYSISIPSIPDQANISKVKENIEFKKPSDTTLVSDSFNRTGDLSKTNVLPLMFTRKIIDMGNSAFDNIIDDSSKESDISLNNNSKLLNNTSVSNINGISMCSTLEMPSLNHTYDITIKGNSTQIGNVKNNSELKNNSMSQPNNETYILKNDSIANKSNTNVSSDLINAKKTLSETYTIGYDFNDISTEFKSGSKFANKSLSTLADKSNICNQSKSPARKSNFIRKLQLDEVSPNYNIINDLTDNDERMNETENISKRFKFKKTIQNADSMVFDNIITTSHENEMSTLENTNISSNTISNLMNCSTETSNILSGSKSKQNPDEFTAELLTQESNALLDEFVENDKTETSLLLKYNTPNNINQSPTKFNFSKQFGRHSLSYQENTMNYEVSKPHSISLNIAHHKTYEEQNNICHKSASNVNLDLHSHILKIQENQTNSQKLLKLDDSLSCESKNINDDEIDKTKLSQSSGLHFIVKPNLDTHSGVFSDLINDDSLNSNTSMTLNITKQIKFKNHNKSKSNSIMFDNLITNSQESNSTPTMKNTLSHSVLCDQSKIQSDEISMFANTDELYNSKSRIISDNSSENVENSKMVNIEESHCSDDESNIFNKTDSTLKHSKAECSMDLISKTSTVNSHYDQKDSVKSEESVNNRFLPNISAGLLDNYDLPSICRRDSTSNSLLIHNNTHQINLSNKILQDNNSIVPVDTKLDDVSAKSFNYSSSNNDGLTLYYTSEIESVRSLRNQSKRLLTSTHSTSFISNNTIKSPEKDKSSENNSKRLTASKQSTSSISNNEELTLMDTTNGFLEQNKSSIIQSKRSTLSNSRNSNNTSNNLSMLKDNTNNVNRIITCSSIQKSHSFDNVQPTVSNITDKFPENEELITLNNTVGCLEQKKSLKNQSNSSLASTSSISNYEGINSIEPIVDTKLDNVSAKSFNSLSSNFSNNERFTLSYTSEIPEIETVRSLINKSKRLLTSRQSTSSSSNNEGLTLFNTTIKSSESNGSFKNHSKSSLASKHSTSSISNGEESTLMDTTNGFLEQDKSSIIQSKRSTLSNSRNLCNTSINSSMLKDNTNNSKRILTCSLRQNSLLFDNVQLAISSITDGLTKNKELIILNNTIESLEQNKSSNNLSKSSLTSKHSTSSISIDEKLTLMDTTNGILEQNTTLSNSRDLYNISSNSSMLEDNTNNVNRIITRSLIQKNQSFNNLQSTISNITDGLPKNDEELIIMNNTVRSLKQKGSPKINSKSLLAPKHSTSFISNDKESILMDTTNGILKQNKSSIIQSKRSTISNSRDLCNISNNLSILEDNTNNANRIITRSSIQKNHSFDNAKPSTSKVSKTPREKTKLSSTRVTRSTLKKSGNRPSNVSVDNESDDSTFWTTLSENCISSKSNTHNVLNEIETSKSNILAVTEYIVNAIGIMSVNKQKAAHPGAFELEDPTDRPLTRRSSVKNSDHSLSILTKAIPLNNTSESISSQTIDNSIIDQPQLERIVKEKFKSLYNKESWITKHLYDFVVSKLYPKYNIYSVKYAEKFIKYLASLFKMAHTNKVDKQLYTDMLRYHMARYGIIKDTFDYIGFLIDYLPRKYHEELLPGCDLEISEVKFDSLKMFIPIMEDEEFLNHIMENLDAA